MESGVINMPVEIVIAIISLFGGVLLSVITTYAFNEIGNIREINLDILCSVRKYRKTLTDFEGVDELNNPDLQMIRSIIYKSNDFFADIDRIIEAYPYKEGVKLGGIYVIISDLFVDEFTRKFDPSIKSLDINRYRTVLYYCIELLEDLERLSTQLSVDFSILILLRNIKNRTINSIKNYLRKHNRNKLERQRFSSSVCSVVDLTSKAQYNYDDLVNIAKRINPFKDGLILIRTLNLDKQKEYVHLQSRYGEYLMKLEEHPSYLKVENADSKLKLGELSAQEYSDIFSTEFSVISSEVKEYIDEFFNILLTSRKFRRYYRKIGKRNS